MAQYTITLWKNEQSVQVPFEDGSNQARAGRNLAIFTRRNLIGLGMMAAGNRKTEEARQKIMHYLHQGYRPHENDLQTKQILVNLRIAY